MDRSRLEVGQRTREKILIKLHRKRGSKEQRIHKTENNQQNGNSKSLPINNYFKCKRIKFSYQKTQNDKMNFLKKIEWYVAHRDHFSFKDTHRLRTKE